MSELSGNGFRGPWETLVDIQREQTKHAVQQTALLERIVEYHQAADGNRMAAVEEVKKHVTTALDHSLSKSEMWWRRAFWIAVSLIALSNIVGAALDRLVAVLK